MRSSSTGGRASEDPELKYLARVLDLINQKHVHSLRRVADIPSKEKRGSMANEQRKAGKNRTKESVIKSPRSLNRASLRRANEDTSLDVHSTGTNERSISISIAESGQRS